MSLREFIEEENAAAEVARIERERPLRAAEQAFQQTARELATLQRDRISQGKDETFAAELPHARMTTAQASEQNAAAAFEFVESNPSYFASDANHERLCGYLFENGCNIATKGDFENAYTRLSEYGLLEDWPAPEPEYEEPEPLIEEIQPEPQPVTRLYDGWSLQDGTPRQYTEWEVQQLTADDFRRVMRIPTLNRTGEQRR
jgi:hypothetical protein